MNEKMLVEAMAQNVERVPKRAEVLTVRQYTADEMEQRVKRLLGMAGEVYGRSFDRNDRTADEERTLVRLPQGGRAIVYHASGAMRLVTGLNPMESLFPNIPARSELTALVEEAAGRLNIGAWSGPNGSLLFERLWQIKASGVGRDHVVADPVLCRVVGAYRQFVGELPVLGPASVAIKLTGEGILDSLAVQVRETSGEVIDTAEILRPDVAARQILQQITSRMSQSQAPIGEVVHPREMRFGYLGLAKRKVQRVLAPVYVAEIVVEGEHVTQAYLVVTTATEMPYLELGPSPSEALPIPQHRAVVMA